MLYFPGQVTDGGVRSNLEHVAAVCRKSGAPLPSVCSSLQLFHHQPWLSWLRISPGWQIPSAGGPSGSCPSSSWRWAARPVRPSRPEDTAHTLMYMLTEILRENQVDAQCQANEKVWDITMLTWDNDHHDQHHTSPLANATARLAHQDIECSTCGWSELMENFPPERGSIREAS